MLKPRISISLLLLLVGCSSTPYLAQTEWNGEGYSETQIDDNVFIVNFSGNDMTDPNDATNFALLRSAELTLSNGYAYFAIVNKESHSEISAFTTPTTTTYNGYSSMTVGGNTYISEAPSANNTIVMLKEKPEGFSYNAAFIVKSIKAKYHLK